MDNANNPPRKPPGRPFFGPRSPANTPPTSASPLGRPAARPFTSRVTPSGHPVPPSVGLASAAPPAEDEQAAARIDQVVRSDTIFSERQRGVLIGELGDVAIPEAEHAPFYGESAQSESPAWRPSDRLEAATDAAVGSAVDSPSLETGTAAMGIVEIMDWKPVPASGTDSSRGEVFPESAQASDPAIEVAEEAVVASPGPSESATTQSADSERDAWANADMVSQESTGVAASQEATGAASSQEANGAADTHRVVPTLATPAFGELTVASGAEVSAPTPDERLGAPAAQNVATEPGDTWKWGEPSTPELSGNAIAAADDSQTIRESDASHISADETSTTPVEPLPLGKAAAETARLLEDVKESEPWTMSPARPYPNRGDAIGDALERIAKRIREGKIILPADATASNDEAALALALAALLRGRSE